MRRILEELHCGNINPNERQLLRGTDYAKALSTFSSSEDKLTELLDGKEKSLFLDLVNAQSVLDETTALEHFIEGFRLEARIAIEVMYDNDGCLVDITD